jgi:hypothetical protein
MITGMHNARTAAGYMDASAWHCLTADNVIITAVSAVKYNRWCPSCCGVLLHELLPCHSMLLLLNVPAVLGCCTLLLLLLLLPPCLAAHIAALSVAATDVPFAAMTPHLWLCNAEALKQLWVLQRQLYHLRHKPRQAGTTGSRQAADRRT